MPNAPTPAGMAETLSEKLTAIRDKFLMATPDKDFTDYAVITRCIESLAAQPSAGAEPFAHFQFNSGWRVWEQVIDEASGQDGVIALYTHPAPVQPDSGGVVEALREARKWIAGQPDRAASVYETSFSMLDAIDAALAPVATEGGEKDKDWAWWASRNEEDYLVGPCASRDEAIQTATEDFDGETFHVVEARKGSMSSYLPSGEQVIEWMTERADDNGAFGEDAYCELVGSPDAISEAEADALSALKAWFGRHAAIFPTPWLFHSTRNGEWIDPSALRTEPTGGGEG